MLVLGKMEINAGIHKKKYTKFGQIKNGFRNSNRLAISLIRELTIFSGRVRRQKNP